MSANVFDLQGSISMDTSGFDKAIKDAVAEGKKLVQALSENTSQMKSLQDSVNQAKAEIESAAKAMKATSDAADDMAKETKRSADAVEGTAKEVEGLKAEVDKANKSVEELADETGNLGTRMDKAESDIDGLKTEVNRLGNEYDDNKKEANELENETNKLGNTVEKTESKFAEFAEFLKTGLATAVKVGTAAIAAAGTAVVGYTKSAFDAYSSYEQLEGGVQTLFGDSSTKVMENAEKAAKSAGMSINNYLDTVMGFSSSLIQSTGRGEQVDLDELKKTLDEEYETQKKAWEKQIKLADSSQKDMLRDQRDADLKRLKEANKAALEQAEVSNMTSVTTEESLARAAELADVAIKDMSDNANKFGTDMTSLQNAYQGFAKQNYTMLDNLKLGYGGTKEEMERLLEDAERLTGQEYDLSSYADIVEAIHAIQESMQIAGTTSAEAEGTLEGSAKSMAAEWENLKLAIAGGDIESIEKHINSLVAGSEQFISNSVPVIERIMEGIGVAIPKVAEVIGKEVPKLVGDLLPPLVQAATSLVSGLVGALPGILKTLTNPTTVNTVLISLQGMWEAIWNGIEALTEQAPDIIPNLLDQIGNALLNSIRILEKPLENIIYNLSDLIYKSLPVLIPIILEMFKTILTSVANLSAVLLPEFADIFVQLFDVLKEQDMADVVLTIIEVLSTIFEAVADAGEVIADNLLPIITTLTELLVNGFEEHGEELQPALTSLLINLLKAVFLVVIDAAVLIIGGALTPLVNAVIALWEGVFQPLSDLLSDGLMDFTEWTDGIKEKVVEFITGIIAKVVGFFEDIGGKIYDFKQSVAEKASEIVNSITTKFTGLIDMAKSWGEDLISNFVSGISDNIHKVTDTVSGIASTVKDYIGFSEPDKGALANFHTFAPDMIDLFASGIRENADKVYKEIDSLASGIGTDFNADIAVERSVAPTAAVSGGIVINNTIDMSGVKIASEMDIDDVAEGVIEKLSEKLEMLDIYNRIAIGGGIA